MRKKKIKILHVAQAAGGVDRYIRMLLKYLDKEKFENILVCSQDFNREDYDGLVDSFEQIEMNRAIGVSDLNSIKEVRRLIKKYNPDKEISKSVSTSKTTPITSKSTLQKSAITHHSIQSINTPSNPSSHPPHHTHPEERIWAGRTPRVPTLRDQTRQDETILHG